MEIKTKVISISLTHDDLVHLFSTGFFGNNYMGINYPLDIPSSSNQMSPDDFYFKMRDDYPEYCLEDRVADLLLNGYSVGVVDYQDDYDTEEEAIAIPINNRKPYMAVSGTNYFGSPVWYPVYKIDLEMIMSQFKKIIEGSAKCSYDDISVNFNNMFNENGSPDFYDGWNLIQYIIFDDVIYG